MKGTVIPVVIGSFGTIPQGLEKGLKNLEIKGQVETILITALLWLARILRKILGTWRDFLSLKLKGKNFSEYGLKISYKSKNS